MVDCHAQIWNHIVMAKLTQRQWDNIEKAMLNGKTAYELAKKYGISRQAIEQKFTCSVKRVKEVANQIVEAEVNFQNLAKNEQVSCANLAEEMLAISANLATGAKFSSLTFNRLSQIAYNKAKMIHDTNPDPEQVLEVGRLQRAANESARVPIDLIKANQAQAKAEDSDPYADMTDDDIRRELAKLEYIK